MTEFDRTTDKVCGCCGNIKPKASYYESLREKGKLLSICRECARNHYNEALDATGSKGAALWSVCVELGLPLKAEACDAVIQQLEINTKRKPDAINLYYNALKSLGIIVTGNYDSDMDLGDFINIKPPAPEPELEIEEVEDEIKEEEIEEAEVNENRSEWDRIWGAMYDDSQCEWLDECFESYTCEILDMDFAMVKRYRDLVKAELRKFEGDESKDVTDEILKLMKLLKIDNFQEKKQSDTEKHIERMAWMIENTKPAECEDLEKYKDYSGFGETWKELARCLRNLIAGSREFPDLSRDDK